MPEVSVSISERLIAIGFGLIWAFFGTLLANRIRFYQLPKERSLEFSPQLIQDTVFIFLIFFGVEFFFPTFSLLWIKLNGGSKPTLVHQGWINILAILCVALAAGSYFYLSSEGTKKRVLREGAFVEGERGKDALFGIATWIIAYPIVIVATQIVALFFDIPKADQLIVQHLKELAEYPVIFGVSIVLIIFVVPVLEELLFRGFLQSSLNSVIQKKWSIVIVSSIFSLLHLSSGLGLYNLELLVSFFILSCYLGIVYERRLSLFAPISLHMFFNGVSIVMIIFGN